MTRFAPARFVPAAVAAWLFATFLALPQASPQVADPPVRLPAGHADTRFLTSAECVACHNGLTSSAGEDISIGVEWRASMMANSARDPYWQAGVRREIADHPAAAEAIEDECAICHMPMSRTMARDEGRHGEIFSHLLAGPAASEDDRLATDGVSCTVCHQIAPDRLGTRESFTGGFVIGDPTPAGERRMFGPFEIDAGHQTIMRSATGMTPAEATHLRESEMCATCHTLYTQALGPKGEVLGELPEQVPYLEWQHSSFRAERSCQSCHMPEITGPAAITSVLGKERMDLRRHTFVGANFFMLRMLNRYRSELGVEALPRELEAAAAATLAQLGGQTADISIEPAGGSSGSGSAGLAVDVVVRNLTGHKLPTAYPSRRVWLHVTVRDSRDQIVFESGAIEPSGLIRGNDNDADAARFEPHHAEIRREDQVQIYESVMRDPNGAVTTGLLQAVAYIKDNRLLPDGFDKATAPADVAVAGEARQDGDFAGGSDRVRYVIATEGRTGPYRIDAELRYQSIAFRWAQNLRPYEAAEARRFVRWYEEMSAGSSTVLASARASLP